MVSLHAWRSTSTFVGETIVSGYNCSMKEEIQFIQDTNPVRILTQEEVQSLAPIFAEHGDVLPDPSTSFFVGSVADGKVVGFIAVQLKIHAEPMWLDSGAEHLFRPLVREVERVIVERCGSAEVYLFAPEGKITRLAEIAGMEKMPFNAMVKNVRYVPTIQPLVLENDAPDSTQPGQVSSEEQEQTSELEESEVVGE